MKRVKTIAQYTLLLLLSLTVGVGCSSEEVIRSGEEMGQLSFSCTQSDKTNQLRSDDAAVEVETQITFFNELDEVQATFLYPEVKGKNVEIPAGEYRVEAHSLLTEEAAAYDIPSYSWSGNVTINPYVVNEIAFEMTLSVVKVTVAYSEQMLTLLEGKSYKTVVDNGNGAHLTFVGNDARVGYILPATGRLTYTFEVMQPNGTPYTIGNEVEVTAADYLALSFDVDAPVESEENFMATVLVDQRLNDVTTNLTLDLTEVTPPTITSETFDLDQTLEVRSGVALPAVLTLQIASTTGLNRLYFNGDKITMSDFSLNRMQDLLHMDAAATQSYTTAGVQVTTTQEEGLIKTATLNLDGLVTKLSPGVNGETLYPFSLTAVDRYYNSFERHFVFKVIGQRFVIEELYSTPQGEGDAISYYLGMVGGWKSVTRPEGVTFHYRKVGEEEWQQVALDALTIDTQNKEFSYRLLAEDSVAYECRVVELDAEGNLSSEGDVVLSHQILDNVNMPNLSLDSWHNDGSTYYPNASDGNSYWASGNEGVTGFGVSKPSNAVPEEKFAIRGKAAKLFTYTGIPFVGVAAGNLYTGMYKTNISDPAASVTMGRPFTGRPRALRGYYSYKPGGLVEGAMDKCHIYILLEGASGRVGYGELKDDRSMSQYDHFNIPITYQSDEAVTKVTLVATSSHLGAEFKGAANSTLFVDEFELIY